MPYRRCRGPAGDHHDRFGSRLCENSDVELGRRKFVSITLNKKRTALAVTVERRKERNNSARSLLVHVFTQPGSKPVLTAPKHHFRSTPDSVAKVVLPKVSKILRAVGAVFV